MVYMHYGILLGHKENEVLSFVTKWVQLETIRKSKQIFREAEVGLKYVFKVLVQ